MSGRRIKESTWYGPLKKAEVALEFAVVGGKDDVDVVVPTLCTQKTNDATEGLVDEFVLDVDHRIDLAHLVGRQRRRDPLCGSLVVRDERAVVPGQPVRRLIREDAFALDWVIDPPGGKVELPPVDAVQFRHRRVPRVVWVGKTDPAKPVVRVVLASQPRDRPISNPIGVVPLARNRVVFHLRCTGVSSACLVHLQL